MKKAIKIFSVILAFTVLAGCSSVAEETVPQGNLVVSTPHYDVYEEDGTHYLYIEKYEPDPLTPGASVLKALPCVYFSTFEEMKQDIETGNFTEDELYHIRRSQDHDGTRIRTLNVTELYEPMVPDELEKGEITWKINENYSVSLQSDMIRGSFFIRDEETYNSWFEEKWTNCIREDPVSMRTETEWDRNATVTYTNDKKTLRKYVKYEIADENKTLKVIEYYHLSAQLQYELSWIYIFGVENEQHYVIYISANEDEAMERPSVEWLSQFGLRKFEG